MIVEDAGVVERLAEAALAFGPFLFALLILIYTTRLTDRKYTEIAERKAPPPSQEELKARRFAYYSSWIVGFALVAVSVGWWWLSNQPQKKDFVRFSIVQLHNESEHLTPRCDDLYVRTVLARRSGDGDGSLGIAADHYFLAPVAGSRPPDQVIWIHYFNEESAVEDNFRMNAADVNGKSYQIVLDSGRANLEELGVTKSGG